MVASEILDSEEWTKRVKALALEVGFSRVGITDTDLSSYEAFYQNWVLSGYHGEMDYMVKHGSKRWEPDRLVPGTTRVIVVGLNYLPPETRFVSVLKHKHKGFISRYALGEDYHRVLKDKLYELALRIKDLAGSLQYRVFVDSAPVLEKPLAEKAGLGWIGKHSNLLSQDASSWFFLGEIYTDLPLKTDTPVASRCGSCRACIDVCPTGAIVADKVVDARRCISYLTIELKGSIPVELRPLLGNRIYGCDDCQLICPWNKFVKSSQEDRFKPVADLLDPDLLSLWSWSESEFKSRTEGLAISRIQYEQWLRNLAVALGNAPYSEGVVTALKARLDSSSVLVREHITWALERIQAVR